MNNKILSVTQQEKNTNYFLFGEALRPGQEYRFAVHDILDYKGDVIPYFATAFKIPCAIAMDTLAFYIEDESGNPKPIQGSSAGAREITAAVSGIRNVQPGEKKVTLFVALYEQ